MKILETLTAQHNSIRAAAASFYADLHEPATMDEARDQLERLDGILALLKDHLHAEDDFLYPVLAADPRPEVREFTTKICSGIDTVKHEVKKHADRWPSAAAVMADRHEYLVEVRALLKVLEYRITKEEDELFPELQEHAA